MSLSSARTVCRSFIISHRTTSDAIRIAANRALLNSLSFAKNNFQRQVRAACFFLPCMHTSLKHI